MMTMTLCFAWCFSGKKPIKIEMNEAKMKRKKRGTIKVFESLITHASFVNIERELQNDNEFTCFGMNSPRMRINNHNFHYHD